MNSEPIVGIGVGTGLVAGRVAWFHEPQREPSAEISVGPTQAQHARAAAAISAVAVDLNARTAAVAKGQQPGANEAGAILEAHAQMAQDPVLAQQIKSFIDVGSTADRAVFDAFEIFAQQFRHGSSHLAERIGDLAYVRDRVLAACRGVAPRGLPAPGYPHILVARNLSPADGMSLDRNMVLGIVTVEGGPTSHTAILARTMGIPAVVGCGDAPQLTEGETILVNATDGQIIRHHNEAVAQPSRPKPLRPNSTSRRTTREPGRTADGYPVPLQANIGATADVEAAVQVGAEGVGLLRTELFFPDSPQSPTTERQTETFRKDLAAFPGQHVVVRVFDSGSDKPLQFLNGEDEPNPALGVRGIRALRRSPNILEQQLAAIAQAARITQAQAWVMASMITNVDEAFWFTERVRAHGLTHAGAMIEVPAAALLADHLLRALDFASIGTNDLTQHVMAADRELGALTSLQDPSHPAVLRLVAQVAVAGRQRDCPVGVCGDAASEPMLACVLVGLGARTLSMPPTALPAVRQSLAQHTLAQCRQLARSALRDPGIDARIKASQDGSHDGNQRTAGDPIGGVPKTRTKC